MLNTRLIVLGALAVTTAFAQKKEDFQALQRDVALVQADVASLRRSIEEKMEGLTALLQQSLEQQAKTSAALNALEQRVNQQFAEQEKTLAAPVADVGARVSTLTDELQFVRESVAAIDNKVGKLSSQMSDLNNAVRVMQAPPPPPDAEGGAQGAAAGPPPGLSADQLYRDAYNDMNTGKNEIALQEFTDYLRWFPETEFAPNAQFYVGYIAFRQNSFEDALNAFSAVIDKYPANANKNADAMYMKGRTLAQLGQKDEAAEVYRAFLKKYPKNELTPKVQTELRSVAPAPATKKRAR